MDWREKAIFSQSSAPLQGYLGFIPDGELFFVHGLAPLGVEELEEEDEQLRPILAIGLGQYAASPFHPFPGFGGATGKWLNNCHL